MPRISTSRAVIWLSMNVASATPPVLRPLLAMLDSQVADQLPQAVIPLE